MCARKGATLFEWCSDRHQDTRTVMAQQYKQDMSDMQTNKK
jgi:hypothetical protein